MYKKKYVNTIFDVVKIPTKQKKNKKKQNKKLF